MKTPQKKMGTCHGSKGGVGRLDLPPYQAMMEGSNLHSLQVRYWRRPNRELRLDPCLMGRSPSLCGVKGDYIERGLPLPPAGTRAGEVWKKA